MTQNKIQWPEDLTPDSLCPFGKHQGIEMKSIPVDWFRWVSEEDKVSKSLRSKNWMLVVRYIKKYVTI